MKKIFVCTLLITQLIGSIAFASEGQDYHNCQANPNCRSVAPNLTNKAITNTQNLGSCDDVALRVYYSCYTGGGAGQDLRCGYLAEDALARCEAMRRAQ
jgi:hypothetical protein